MRKVVRAMTMPRMRSPHAPTSEAESHRVYRRMPAAQKGATTLANLVESRRYEMAADALTAGSGGRIGVDASSEGMQ